MKNKIPLLMSAAFAAGTARAHEGHGATTALHWHAIDLFGFVVLAVMVGVAAWWIRRK